MCFVILEATLGNVVFAMLVFTICCSGFSCRLMMCQNAEELKKMANWTGVKGGSRENLMDNICGKNFVYHNNTWNMQCVVV